LLLIYPLLGNGFVNTFPQYAHATIGHPLLGNGPRNTNRRDVFLRVRAEWLLMDTLENATDYRTEVEN
jgi:hypothetical protein